MSAAALNPLLDPMRLLDDVIPSFETVRTGAAEQERRRDDDVVGRDVGAPSSKLGFDDRRRRGERSERRANSPMLPSAGVQICSVASWESRRFSARDWICRTRSRVTPRSVPTFSSVTGELVNTRRRSIDISTSPSTPVRATHSRSSANDLGRERARVSRGQPLGAQSECLRNVVGDAVRVLARRRSMTSPSVVIFSLREAPGGQPLNRFVEGGEG